MGILDNVLKLFVGDKSKKDISDIQPIVAQIKKQLNKPKTTKQKTINRFLTKINSQISGQIK